VEITAFKYNTFSRFTQYTVTETNQKYFLKNFLWRSSSLYLISGKDFPLVTGTVSGLNGNKPETVTDGKALPEVEYNDEDLQRNFFSIMAEELNFVALLSALNSYNVTYGTTRIDKDFLVPVSEIYPSSLHGENLSHLITQMKRKVRVQKDHEKAKALFIFGIVVFRSKVCDFPSTLEALNIFKSLYGNLKVPQKFIIPEDKIWPKKLWGISLGIKV
jgi:hypothetical protein